MRSIGDTIYFNDTDHTYVYDLETQSFTSTFDVLGVMEGGVFLDGSSTATDNVLVSSVQVYDLSGTLMHQVVDHNINSEDTHYGTASDYHQGMLAVSADRAGIYGEVYLYDLTLSDDINTVQDERLVHTFTTPFDNTDIVGVETGSWGRQVELTDDYAYILSNRDSFGISRGAVYVYDLDTYELVDIVRNTSVNGGGIDSGINKFVVEGEHLLLEYRQGLGYTTFPHDTIYAGEVFHYKLGDEADWVSYAFDTTGVTVNLETQTVSGGYAEGDENIRF